MKILDLSFGKFAFYPDVIIGRVDEGVHFNMQLNKILVDHVIDHYGKDHKLGYISLRENSYSVDPMIHMHNTQHKNLCSVGIVETGIIRISFVALERKYYKPRKLQSFLTVEEALIWTNNQILESITEFLPSYHFN